MILTSAGTAAAQDWTGAYVSGSVGQGLQKIDDAETVGFDTNLDGTFTDTVRTVAGADAFSTGFCGGRAVNADAAGGCLDDEDGIDVGGRVGYDRQFGRVVAGALLELSTTDVADSVTAFSTTPAFYSLTRTVDYVAGFRGRIGIGSGRVLLYGTAGSAWGSVEQQFTTSNLVNTFVPADDDEADDDDDDADDEDEGPSESVWGYQAGGGIEFRVSGRWSVTGEYLFTSLDNREESAIHVRGPAPVTNPFILANSAGTVLQRTEKFEFQAVRVGIGYRF